MWPFKRKKLIDQKDSIDVNKPVANPDLKLAFKTFNSNKSEETVLKVLSEIKKANFLILINQDELVTSKSPGKTSVTIERGNILKFLQIFDENGNPFIPIFTDWKEIDLWTKDRKDIASWIMTTNEVFKFILSNETVMGLVINPFSDRWNMSKKQIDNFLKEI